MLKICKLSFHVKCKNYTTINHAINLRNPLNLEIMMIFSCHYLTRPPIIYGKHGLTKYMVDSEYS